MTLGKKCDEAKLLTSYSNSPSIVYSGHRLAFGNPQNLNQFGAGVARVDDPVDEAQTRRFPGGADLGEVG
ncbi:MAG: hypothetical protein EAZ91_03940 [Cytophagales bacterium]|nr:MAG: hypothetical protein EAZ91_03940 [Cytophagales bacterium]